MAFCSACGQELSASAAFCPKCGKAASGDVSQLSQGAFSQNAAAFLSYIAGWLTGLIFLLIDNRPFVRFHAMQSLVAFGGLHILMMALAGWFWGGWMVAPLHWMMLGGGWWMLYGVFHAAVFVAWIVCMVKAWQGQRFKLPLVGDLAESWTSRTP